jgi:hypothetical protein
VIVIPSEPLPIKDFGNAALRESVTKALATVPHGHGNAFLDIDNKGAGVMAMHRFDSGWALMGGIRYNREDKGVAATVAASW